MKGRWLLISATTISAALCSAHALELTPREGFRELEGFRIPVLKFADDGSEVTWQPPSNWRVSGGGERVTVYPPERAQAAMALQTFPRKPAPAESLEDLAEWARRLLPQDATDVSAADVRENPFTLEHLASTEFIFRYASQGSRFTTAIAIVDLSVDQRLAVIVSARAEDFGAVHEDALASMFSWQWKR